MGELNFDRLPECIYLDDARITSFITDSIPTFDLATLENEDVFAHLGESLFSTEAINFRISLVAKLLFAAPVSINLSLLMREVYKKPLDNPVYMNKIGIHATAWHEQIPKGVSYSLRTFINLSECPSERWKLFHGSLTLDVREQDTNTD